MAVKTTCIPNLEVSDGDFDSAAAWNFGINWNIAAGEAVNIENGILEDGFLNQLLPFQKNHTYRIKIDIIAITLTGGNEFQVGIAGVGSGFTTTGSKTFYLTIAEIPAAPRDQLRMFLKLPSQIGNTVTIDNISVLDLSQALFCIRGFAARENTFFTVFPLPDNEYIYRVNNVEDSTNCLIRFNADDL